MIEGRPKQNCALPESTLDTACLHTRVYNGFNIVRTTGDEDTLRWIMYTNKYITSRIDEFTKESILGNNFYEYDKFEKRCAKNSNLNLEEVFARQLRRIRGIGSENTTSIVKVFRTPKLLFACYDK